MLNFFSNLSIRNKILSVNAMTIVFWLVLGIVAISTERLLQVIELVAEGGIWLDPYIAKFLAVSLAAQPEQGGNWSRQTYNSELTEREKEVLTLIVKGKTNKEIAKTLGITLPTTKVHVSNLIQKLSVDDRTQAAVKAIQEGLVGQDEAPKALKAVLP